MKFRDVFALLLIGAGFAVLSLALAALVGVPA